MCECENCYKKCDEVYEVSDRYICLSCLDDLNNSYEMLVEVKNE